jgi:hypothetical protein
MRSKNQNAGNKTSPETGTGKSYNPSIGTTSVTKDSCKSSESCKLTQFIAWRSELLSHGWNKLCFSKNLTDYICEEPKKQLPIVLFSFLADQKITGDSFY